MMNERKESDFHMRLWGEGLTDDFKMKGMGKTEEEEAVR